MRVTVRFVDGERLDGNAEQVSLDSGGFTLVGTGGNTRSIWVGAGAIKYVAIHPATSETYEHDPRDADRLPKLVLHFLDGETLRTYQDQAYARQAGGFTMRLWDDEEKQLVKALVSGASLKGVFTVEEWDSRTEEEKRRHGAEEDAAEVEAAVEHEAWVEQEPLFDPGPEPAPEPDEAVQEAVRVAVQEALPTAVQEALPAAVQEALPAAVQEAVPAAVHEAVLATMPEAAIVAAHVVADEAEPAERPRRDLPAVRRGDSEERRATFGSGLVRRGKLVQALTPEEERHLQLRARISQVLGSITAAAPHGVDEDDGGTG